jgi:hypothetical protein
MQLIYFIIVLSTTLVSQAFAGQVDLARPGRDRPEDNGFFLSGDRANLATLDQLLGQHLSDTLQNLMPKTDDSTVSKVTWSAKDNEVLLTFRKSGALGFHATVKIGGHVQLRDFRCSDASQRGYAVILNTSDPKLSETHDYVSAIEIHVCARETHEGLEVGVQRVLDTGPKYESWVGSLLGDFMRGYARSLRLALQSR